MSIIFLHERSHTQEWNPPKVIIWIENIKHPWHYLKRKKINAEKKTSTILSVKTSKLEQEERPGSDSSMLAISHLINTKEIRDIAEYLKKITHHLEYQKSRKEMRKIWRTALETVDLILLITFLIANSVLTYCMVLNNDDD